MVTIYHEDSEYIIVFFMHLGVFKKSLSVFYVNGRKDKESLYFTNACLNFKFQSHRFFLNI